MKISTLLSILMLFASGMASSQTVPNADFETWDYYNTWNLEPESWSTYNNQVQESVTQDSAAYSGAFAMRVEPLPNGLGEEGIATVIIPLEAIPAQLNFYAKWWRTATASVGGEIEFFNEENSIYTEPWWPQELSSEWALIEIPLSQIGPILTHAELRFIVQIGDFAPGEAWISVDDIGFSQPNDIEEFEIMDYDLYPNPSSGFFKIPSELIGSDVQVLDQIGRTIKRSTIENGLDLTELQKGNYTVIFRKNEEVLGRSRVVLE